MEKEKDLKDQLVISFNLSEGLIFEINDEKKSFNDPKTIASITHSITNMVEFYGELMHTKKHFDLFDEAKFREDQLKLAKDQEEGDDFKFMTAFNCSNFFPDENYEKATKNILKSFKKSYGKNSIESDPERSWSRFYAKDLEEITAFEKHVNKKYLKPFLDKYS